MDNWPSTKEGRAMARLDDVRDRLLADRRGEITSTVPMLADMGQDGGPSPGTMGTRRRSEDEPKKSQATLLIELAADLEAFHDPDHNGYAVVADAVAARVLPIRSQDFKRWLAGRFYETEGRGCNSNAIADALNTIEARALHDGRERPVFLRVANLNGRIYLDCCDPGWRVIEIDTDGWRVLDRSPVAFIRKRGNLPLPVPEPGGSVEALRPFLNIAPADFPLVVGWLLAALRGKGPYPVLVLQGEQGTGKSTLCRVLRAFVDPSTAALRSPPREVRDLLVSALNAWVPCLDNLSGLAPEFSDALCRLSTGGALDARALYTDTDQVLVEVQRPVLVNGIDEIATRPDLAERAIVLNLPVIDPGTRRQESGFWKEFEAAKPRIFGAILDALAGALRMAPSVHLSRLPRLGDFAVWVTAAEQALGWHPNTFMAAYWVNQRHAIEAGIEASPVGSTLVAHMEGRTSWIESPTELLATLSDLAGPLAKSRAWPQSPKGLKNALVRLAPSLRKVGITWTQEEGNARRYQITRTPQQPPYPPNRLPETPEATDGEASSGFQADTCGSGGYSGACVNADVGEGEL